MSLLPAVLLVIFGKVSSLKTRNVGEKKKNYINIFKIWEIIFGFGRSGGNFDNWETPERIVRLGPLCVLSQSKLEAVLAQTVGARLK